MSLPLILIGAGGHASVLMPILRAAGRRIAGCIAREKPALAALQDIAYLGGDEQIDGLPSSEFEMVIAVGSIRAARRREEIFERVTARGFAVASVIHRTAIIDGGAVIGRAAQILAGAIIQPGARLGDNVIINTGAIIEHGCAIGDHGHIASGAVVTGNVSVGRGAHVGAGAVILQGLKIGAGATVGAGACVIRDVAEGATVAGNPAAVRAGKT